MPRQANGTYQPPAGTAAVSGAAISSANYNTLQTDLGNEITNSLDRGGRGGMTANLPMANNRITSLGAPVSGSDAANKTYVDTTATTTTNNAITALNLGTAAFINTGSTAYAIPRLDENGVLYTQRVANSAGWGAVTKSVGISNLSGVYFDDANNALLSASDGSGNTKIRWSAKNASDHLVDGFPAFVCRAWVNFNGTGTVAIRASGNVTSITDNGVGDYTVNFTTAMPDANYCAALSCRRSAFGDGNMTVKLNQTTNPTTTQFRIQASVAQGAGNEDTDTVFAAFFR